MTRKISWIDFQLVLALSVHPLFVVDDPDVVESGAVLFHKGLMRRVLGHVVVAVGG